MRFVFHGVVVYNCTQYIKRLFLKFRLQRQCFFLKYIITNVATYSTFASKTQETSCYAMFLVVSATCMAAGQQFLSTHLCTRAYMFLGNSRTTSITFHPLSLHPLFCLSKSTIVKICLPPSHCHIVVSLSQVVRGASVQQFDIKNVLLLT